MAILYYSFREVNWIWDSKELRWWPEPISANLDLWPGHGKRKRSLLNHIDNIWENMILIPLVIINSLFADNFCPSFKCISIDWFVLRHLATYSLLSHFLTSFASPALPNGQPWVRFLSANLNGSSCPEARPAIFVTVLQVVGCCLEIIDWELIINSWLANK